MVALSGVRVCRLRRGTRWLSTIHSCSRGIMPLVLEIAAIRVVRGLRVAVCGVFPTPLEVRKGSSGFGVWGSEFEAPIAKFSVQNCSRIGPARRPILLLELASITYSLESNFLLENL